MRTPNLGYTESSTDPPTTHRPTGRWFGVQTDDGR